MCVSRLLAPQNERAPGSSTRPRPSTRGSARCACGATAHPLLSASNSTRVPLSPPCARMTFWSACPSSRCRWRGIGTPSPPAGPKTPPPTPHSSSNYYSPIVPSSHRSRRSAPLTVPLEAIATLDNAIAQRAHHPPDVPLCQALPGAGPVFAPRLLVAFGAQRERSAPLPHGKNMRGAHRCPNAAGSSPGGTGVSRVPSSCGTRSSSGPPNRSGIPSGRGLFPAATRPGASAVGRRARAGVQVEPSPLAGLAGAHPV
jgi:hypothetical protein